MIIQSLELNNYRNYHSLSIGFSDKTNILYGDNAQGKTNILESIYLTATTKSHRGSKDKEIIRMNQEEAHIRMRIERNQTEHRIDMHLKKNKTKGVAINGIPIKKTSELFGLIHVISFSPEDLNIIKAGPSERRRFIDMELCQLDKIYLFNLSNYNKVLIQRNNLLKQIGYNRELLDTLLVWNLQLVQYGTEIIRLREHFIHEINKITYDIHNKLTAKKEFIELKYDKNTEADLFLDKLEKSLERDLKNKTTCVGPHRDDLIFYINQLDVRTYGSQGQQRTSALSLKLAEIELVSKRLKDNPVLLLDDVLSELDKNRQRQLLNSIQHIQTIITCTGLEDLIKDRFTMDKIYHVVDGTIEN